MTLYLCACVILCKQSGNPPNHTYAWIIVDISWDSNGAFPVTENGNVFVHVLLRGHAVA
jgi:hypothetical protein